MERCQTTGIVLALAFALGTASAGCLGNFQQGGESDGGPQQVTDGGASVGDQSLNVVGKNLYNTTVDPLLEARCAGCHGKMGGVGPAFIAPVAYDSIVAYPGLITPDPNDSRIITKGPHNGAQWFSMSETMTLLAWLSVEAKNLPAGGGSSSHTLPQKFVVGANTIALDSASPDAVGATLTFDASLIGSTLHLTNLTVNAKGANGLHVVHPLFITVSNGSKNPDPVDSFSNLDQSIAQGNSTPLGPGTLFLNNVGGMDQIEIAFKTLVKFAGTGGGTDGGVMGGGACKQPGAFTKDAQPTLAQRCIGCHGGNNGAATAALDMTKVTDLSAGGQDTACGQVKTKIDPVTVANSPIFVVTKPGNNSGHPFKFPDNTTFGAFQTAASAWITQEK